jgi:hypothetical protein
MEVAYTRLVTINTDNLTETSEYRTGIGAHWPFLSDPGRMVQKDLDIAEYTDPLHNPMIPHVIVLEPGLVIYKIYIGYWFWGRPTMEDLRQDLRAVTKKCRPDWDITTPEMKAAWQEDRKERFYPYGKTFAPNSRRTGLTRKHCHRQVRGPKKLERQRCAPLDSLIGARCLKITPKVTSLRRFRNEVKASAFRNTNPRRIWYRANAYLKAFRTSWA